MIGQRLDLGSLNDTLGSANPYKNLMGWIEGDDEFRRQFPDVVEGAHKSERTGTVNLLNSAGPISDAYILGDDPASLIVGPGGSGKTIASCKKALVEAKFIQPGPDRVRRYVLGTWRQKYVNLWQATIPSWWKLFPREQFSRWTGASPRQAEHIIEFQDEYGPIVLTNRFRAFNESADPEDVLGNEFTDCYLNEWSTLPEELFIALIDRVGREPPFAITQRAGRFFGDSNAPDVMNYTYRDFFESERDGYKLYLQPSGLSPFAENIAAVGRGYYENSVRMNQHRPWWIRRMVHAQPGFTRSTDPVYGKYDDARNLSHVPLEVLRSLPVVVGVDGGATPAAAYFQELASGALRIIAEIQIERGRMREIADHMLALEARRFQGCEFRTICDPAMCGAEDTADLSDRQLLSKYIGRTVKPGRTQSVGARVDAVACKFDLTLENGVPGLLLDPSCKGLRRGFNQTFHYRRIRTGEGEGGDRGEFAKTYDGHVHEALQYGALECGSSELRMRLGERERRRQQRREEARQAPRYDPMAARRARL